MPPPGLVGALRQPIVAAMPAAPRISPAEIFAPHDWAPFQARSAWKGPLLVAHCWAIIALAVAVGIWQPILIPLCVMIIGTRQLGLAILMHEAAHGALAKNLKLNDLLGHWLCAVPIGASLNAYRPYHLSHHRFAQQPEDPDLVLSAPFPVSGTSLRRKMIRDLTGQTFFKQRVLLPLALLRKRAAKDEAHDYEAIVTGRSVVPFLLVNAAMLLGFSLAGIWWAWFALWLLPMATWFPLVTRLRNIAEHACVEGSATDPFRAEHHLFMHVACWNLPRLHRAIQATEPGGRMEVAPGYVSVLRQAASKPA